MGLTNYVETTASSLHEWTFNSNSFSSRYSGHLGNYINFCPPYGLYKDVKYPFCCRDHECKYHKWCHSMQCPQVSLPLKSLPSMKTGIVSTLSKTQFCFSLNLEGISACHLVLGTASSNNWITYQSQRVWVRGWNRFYHTGPPSAVNSFISFLKRNLCWLKNTNFIFFW